LYVGDLHPEVTEAMLFEIFSSAGGVSSIRVCRDSVTRRSLGYAYVNFHNVPDAERALDTLNFAPIKQIPCRVMWSHRDPSVRKNAAGNLFVKNLPPQIDNKALYDLFSTCGSILSCKVATDFDMKSKGFGFVHLAGEEQAVKAIDELNDREIDGHKLYVGKFERRQERTGGRFTNVYVKNIPSTWSKDRFEQEFSQFGKINSLCLPGENDHKGFGFVNYTSHDEAQRAVEEGSKITTDAGSKPLFVDRFQKKAERRAYLERVIINIRRERAERSKVLNLYVKNLDDDVNDEKLKELFAEFGPITSAVVMKEEKTELSRGFGFVCFEKEADAERAITVMRTRSGSVGRKPLYVARAQRREERRVHLENEFQTSMVQRMQYSQLFYPPVQMAQPTGMFFPQNMMRRYPPSQYRQQQPFPIQQQFSQPKRGGREGGYYSARGGVQMSQQQRGNTRRAPLRNHQPPVTPAPVVPQGTQGKDLASILAAEASPERQKNILGERLFPLIHKEHPQLAGKITGMLLEMDVSEILKLLDSPTEIQAKINEAMDVLNAHK